MESPASESRPVSWPIAWRNDALVLLDQRVLPSRRTYVELRDVESTAQAITDMIVRGAPAIGITAAYGVVLAARRRYAKHRDEWREAIVEDLDLLRNSRPTAVNLGWAIDRMQASFAAIEGDPVEALLEEAERIHDEDVEANKAMGQLGAALIAKGSSVLTHCNAGALATGGYGTALGVVRAAHEGGKLKNVYADETRPWMQGTRLTAWELIADDIDVTLVADSAAAWLMNAGKVQWLIVGSDRIAANGDVANKIGTYQAAIAAKHHGVKVMVVAPTSTIDMSLASGAQIPIETRAPEELWNVGGQRFAAEGAHAWNPVFDVTPAELVDVIVTERGVVEHPDSAKMAALMG